jgi:hypothetical protein
MSITIGTPTVPLFILEVTRSHLFIKVGRREMFAGRGGELHFGKDDPRS